MQALLPTHHSRPSAPGVPFPLPTPNLPPTPARSHLLGHLAEDGHLPSLHHSLSLSVPPPWSVSSLGAGAGPVPEMVQNTHTSAEEMDCFALWMGASRPKRRAGPSPLRSPWKLPCPCRASFSLGWGLPSSLLPGLSPQTSEACPQHRDSGLEMGDGVSAGRRWCRMGGGG